MTAFGALALLLASVDVYAVFDAMGDPLQSQNLSKLSHGLVPSPSHSSAPSGKRVIGRPRPASPTVITTRGTGDHDAVERPITMD